ncbi:MAG: ATP-binding cassette domain-containing protein [Myxococcaceae bacterium]|nr:ATP-binding cassette domain-containing protein [Myxococcaceae bacterium]
MIRVEGLTKTFVTGRGAQRAVVQAVRGVSFSAPDGAITALLGPNGAGKTTTLRMVSTLVKPDAGRATVGAHDVVSQPEAVRADLGVLSDARGLYTRLSGRENIRYYGALRGLSGKPLDGRIDELAQLLEFEHLLERRTEGFSTGEKLKVALARALVHDPQHVLLDEPTNGLDVVSARALRRMLLRLKQAGKCLVFSSHVMQEVEALCERVVVVAKGQTLHEGTVDELKARTGKGSLEDAFVHLAFDGKEGAP